MNSDVYNCLSARLVPAGNGGDGLAALRFFFHFGLLISE